MGLEERRFFKAPRRAVPSVRQSYLAEALASALRFVPQIRLHFYPRRMMNRVL